jgi:hypothetical protein
MRLTIRLFWKVNFRTQAARLLDITKYTIIRKPRQIPLSNDDGHLTSKDEM